VRASGGLARFVLRRIAALVLLFGANLMMRSVSRVLDVSPGFQPARLLTGTLNLSGERYRTREAIRAFHDAALARLAAMPGVTGATTIDQAPLSGPGNSGGFSVVGSPSAPATTVLIRTVAPNYFDRIGTILLFPVFHVLGGTGSNAQYEIIGWVGFSITGSAGGGNSGKVYGSFTHFIAHGLQASDPGSQADFGVRAIQLVR